MASAASSCLSCHRAFPANGELATIPDAGKVAFDPLNRRVWRICASCSEWNLLGPDASAMALPEIEARFRAAPKGASSKGFALARVGTALELLRVGAIGPSGTNEVALLARRRRLQWMQPLRIVAVGICAAMIGLDLIAAYQETNSIVSVVQFISLSSVAWLAYQVSRLRHHLGVNKRVILFAATVAAIGGASWVLRHHNLYEWISRTLSLLIVNGLIALLPPVAYRTLPLSSGKTLRLYWGDDLKQATLWWNPVGELFTGGVPRLPDLGGEEAVKALRVLLKYRTAFVTRATTESAYDLVRASGGLAGLFHALEGFRHENTGRVWLSDLPKVYLVALDLALASNHDDSSISGDLRKRALEAAAVAHEAEKLDKPPV